MKAVIQKEKTGCAIASSAAIAGISYDKAKKVADKLGISASNKKLWSEANHIRQLLAAFKIKTSEKETPFSSWESLPDCALLSIKWHIEAGKPYWHWVVFVRDSSGEYVLDSSKRLKKNIRTDFGKINPKWFIEVTKQA